jgi:hypothetical protein
MNIHIRLYRKEREREREKIMKKRRGWVFPLKLKFY